MGFFRSAAESNRLQNTLLNQKGLLDGLHTERLVDQYADVSPEVQKVIVQILKERGYSKREIEQLLKQ